MSSTGWEVTLERGGWRSPAGVLEALRREAGSGSGEGEAGMGSGEEGWAWLVDARRLHIVREGSEQAFVLPLPSSGLPYSPRLVALLAAERDGALPGLLVCSPEGLLRLWPSLGIPARSTQLQAQLGGQVAHSLHRLAQAAPAGLKDAQRPFLLVTTTGSLALVHASAAHNALRADELQSRDDGVVGSMTQRIFSMFASSPQAKEGQGKSVLRVLTKDGGVWLVDGSGVDEWWLGEDVVNGAEFKERLELTKLLQDGLMRAVWGLDTPAGRASCRGRVTASVLDAARWGPKGLLLYVTATNAAFDNVPVFALVLLREASADAADLDAVCLLDNVRLSPRHLLQSHLLAPQEGLDPDQLLGSTLYLVSARSALAFRLRGGERQLGLGQREWLELAAEEGLLGAGLGQGGAAVVCQRSVGFRQLRLTPKGMGEQRGGGFGQTSQAPSGVHSALLSDDGGDEDETQEEREVDVFRQAFICFTLQKEREAVRMFNQLDVADLPSLIADLSRDIVDDFPQADPRWQQSHPPKTPRTQSLLVTMQIQDKVRTLSILKGFLATLELGPRLDSVPVSMDGHKWPSVLHLMDEHGEKLKLGLALSEATDPSSQFYSQLWEAALADVLAEREEEEEAEDGARLTTADLVFRKLSLVHQLFPAIATRLEFHLASEAPDPDVVRKTLEGLRRGLEAASEPKDELRLSGHWPWRLTAEMRSSVESAVQKSLEWSAEAVEGRKVAEAALRCADVYLARFGAFVAATSKQRGGEAFDAALRDARDRLLRSVAAMDEERAVGLAEKHADLAFLLRLSEAWPEEDKQSARKRWKERFPGFANELYRKLKSEDRLGELLEESGATETELGALLGPHPRLRWQQEVRTQDFKAAASSLLSLASSADATGPEAQLYASLAKLARVERHVGADDADLRQADLRLQLSKAQAAMEGVDEDGVWRSTNRPLSPAQLIDQLIGTPGGVGPAEAVQAAQVLTSCASCAPEKAEEWAGLATSLWAAALGREGWERWAELSRAGVPASDLLRTNYAAALSDVLKLKDRPARLALPSADRLLASHDVPAHLRQNKAFENILRTSEEKALRSLLPH